MFIDYLKEYQTQFEKLGEKWIMGIREHIWEISSFLDVCYHTHIESMLLSKKNPEIQSL